MPQNADTAVPLTMIDHKVRNTFVMSLVLLFNLLLFLALLSYSAEDTQIITGGVESHNIQNWIGLLGANVSYVFILSFGLVAYPAVLLIVLCSLRQYFGKVHRFDWSYIFCIVLIILGATIFVGGQPSMFVSWTSEMNMATAPAGALGSALNHPVHGWLNAILNQQGSTVVSVVMIVAGLVVVWLYDWNHFFKHKVIGSRPTSTRTALDEEETDLGVEDNGPGTVLAKKSKDDEFLPPIADAGAAGVAIEVTNLDPPQVEEEEELEQAELFEDMPTVLDEELEEEPDEPQETKSLLQHTTTMISSIPTLLGFKVKAAKPLNTMQREFVAKRDGLAEEDLVMSEAASSDDDEAQLKSIASYQKQLKKEPKVPVESVGEAPAGLKIVKPQETETSPVEDLDEVAYVAEEEDEFMPAVADEPEEDVAFEELDPALEPEEDLQVEQEPAGNITIEEAREESSGMISGGPDLGVPVLDIDQEDITDPHRVEVNAVGEAMDSKASNRGQYLLPQTSLMTPIEEKVDVDPSEIQRKLDAIVQTLDNFKIKVEPGGAVTGPRLTMFEVIPDSSVRVNKIETMSDNLKFELAAQSIRIQAPIPGRRAVGIEVPNDDSSAVSFRKLMEAPEYVKSQAILPVALGKDITGEIVMMDLAKAPHLLIAGATGAGKSVFMNTLILSLIYRYSPDDLRMIMVDPKVVEFAPYAELPHLVHPVITDPQRVPAALRWAVFEMECRYKTLAKVGVKNLEAFNKRKKKPDEPTSDDEGNVIPEKLPLLVVIIDELADLMMVAKADVETSIARIAQKARAVGIHLVVATQRPSVDVVTGMIKANFPTRIAFQVTSQTDSRTILDAKGAEGLLGRGDMLFNPPGSSNLLRVQAAYVPDEDIERIVSHCSAQQEQEFIDVLQKTMSGDDSDLEQGELFPEMGAEDGGFNQLVEQAVEIIRKDKRASTSHIQRRLRVGYNKAANIMEALEDRGIIGPQIGSGKREIYLDDSE